MLDTKLQEAHAHLTEPSVTRGSGDSDGRWCSRPYPIHTHTTRTNARYVEGINPLPLLVCTSPDGTHPIS
jgi:hypothetical protein